MNRFLSLISTFALALVLSANANAQPEIMQQGDIRYVSGGVAVEGRDALEAIADQFNLKVVLAWDAGNYVSGVRVDVQNSQGDTVLSTATEGPWLYANLPADNYTITASYEGDSQQQSADIQQDEQTEVLFTW